jgi:hypothetical protein
VLQITISKRAAVFIVLALILVIPGIAGATHVFLDVGDGSTHAEGIEWVADAGVSVGCGNGTNYCPDDSVSRAQMGTFMYRLSGNDPATDPSVNADAVDGYHADELVRFAGAHEDNDALVGVSGIAATVEITAPRGGYLVISASSDVYNYDSLDDLRCEIEVNGSEIDSSTRQIQLSDADNNAEEDCSTDAYYTTVLGGDFTVDFTFTDVNVHTVVDETVLNVIYIPFGGEGNTPPIVIFGE